MSQDWTKVKIQQLVVRTRELICWGKCRKSHREQVRTFECNLGTAEQSKGQRNWGEETNKIRCSSFFLLLSVSLHQIVSLPAWGLFQCLCGLPEIIGSCAPPSLTGVWSQPCLSPVYSAMCICSKPATSMFGLSLMGSGVILLLKATTSLFAYNLSSLCHHKLSVNLWSATLSLVGYSEGLWSLSH